MDRKIRRSIVGGVYTNASPNFQRGILKGMARTIKCDDDNGYVARIEKRVSNDGGTETQNDTPSP